MKCDNKVSKVMTSSWELVPRLGRQLGLLVLVLACLTGQNADSETSYTWRLDMDMGKVIPASHFPPPPLPPPDSKSGDDSGNDSEASGSSPGPATAVQLQETVMDILLSTVTTPDGSWKKTSSEQVCSSCERPGSPGTQASRGPVRNNRGVPVTNGHYTGGPGASLSRFVRNRISNR